MGGTKQPPTRRASCHEARATLIRHGFCRATFLYFPYCGGFNLLPALADFLKHVCHNFPFAFFSQLFFIQPLVRTLFKAPVQEAAGTAARIKSGHIKEYYSDAFLMPIPW